MDLGVEFHAERRKVRLVRFVLAPAECVDALRDENARLLGGLGGAGGVWGYHTVPQKNDSERNLNGTIFSTII